MTPAMDDTALIERCLAGDRGAFDELMRRHEDRVFAVCLRTLRDREAALDATQDTFISVFRKLDRFDGRSAFTTWLHRVAVNTALDRIRRDKRRATSPMDERREPADPFAQDVIDAAGLRPELEAALAATVGAFVAIGLLAMLKAILVDGVLSPSFQFTNFVGWDVWANVSVVVFVTGVTLASIAALITLRRYLRV